MKFSLSNILNHLYLYSFRCISGNLWTMYKYAQYAGADQSNHKHLPVHSHVNNMKNILQRSQDDVDAMHLAMCNVDSITKLKRFRGKCQPTFIFCYVSIS